MPDKTHQRILILGGTEEAAEISRSLAARDDVLAITSLAGRTSHPQNIAGPCRIGGFGGAAGLARYLLEQDIDLVIDATHPFARRISANAVEACHIAEVPLDVRLRPPWQQKPGDRWIEVKDLKEAAAALPANARAFLALGSQHLQAFHGRSDVHFIIRMIEAPDGALPFADYELVIGRPGETGEAERALFEPRSVTHLVCRNSGGRRGYAKIEAARAMDIAVIMIARPDA